MALDSFISSVRREVAKKFDLKTDAEIDAFFIGVEESAKDNQEALEKRDKMLRDTVAELVEAKRLLKLAVEDIHFAYFCFQAACKNVKCEVRCPYYNNDTKAFSMGWRYYKEAEKLLKEEEENG